MQLSSFIQSKSSIVTYWLLPHLGRFQLEEITPRHVAGLLEAVRESGASDSHTRSVLHCLRSVLRAAMLQRLIPSDPTEGFRVKVRKAQVMALSPAQRDALDAELLDNNTPSAAAQPLRIILWTGLRISEILALHFRDFDPDTKTLTVRSGKSNAAARRVDVPDCVLGTIHEYLRQPLWEIPHPTTLRRVLSTACAAAGVPQIRIHDLRHTRITTLLLAGVPVGYVSKQAGHKSAATTLDIYDHWIQIADREQRRAWTNA